jgi:hypothetical protein
MSHPDWCDMLEVIAREEAVHAAFGSKWVPELSGPVGIECIEDVRFPRGFLLSTAIVSARDEILSDVLARLSDPTARP